MEQTRITAAARPPLSTATLLALMLAIMLMGAWTAGNWAVLSHFRLPDNDDMMRLAQVRDWLAGQSFADLSQHRLGPPEGASMHWSRLADIGPAAIILALTPLLGRAGAELAMLSLYPGLLFLAAILVGRRLALRLDPNAQVEPVIALALAFPANSLFAPGRIDHHGLQILLTLWFVERLVTRPGWASGAWAGAAAALSLAVGLETLPFVLFGMAALFIAFMRAGPSGCGDERRRLLGFGLALGGTTLACLWLLRPHIWPQSWCDGFTPASTSATLIAAAFFALLATVPLPDRRVRLGAGVLLGLAASPLVLATSSVCLAGPYGALDPMLQDLWMSHVGEARGVFGQASFGVAFSYVAYGFAGLAALAWMLRAGKWRQRRWQVFAIVYGLGTLLTVAQIRATYVLSALAAVPAALLIGHIRRTSPSPGLRLCAWLGCIGVTYAAIGTLVDRLATPQLPVARGWVGLCTSAKAMAVLDRLPPGRIAAPLDSAAYIVGSTHHSVIAAPYHRNNPGNVAMYRFFLGDPAAAPAIAAQWDLSYVVACRSSFAELGRAITHDRAHLIGQLLTGASPSWLQRIKGTPPGILIYKVRQPQDRSG